MTGNPDALDAAQEAFLSQVRRMAALRTDTPCRRFYSVWRKALLAEFPHLNEPALDSMDVEIRRLAGFESEVASN